MVLQRSALQCVMGAFLAVVGCSESKAPQEPGPETTVTAPADFEFDTKKTVVVDLELAPELQVAATSASIEIKRADGKVIYEGPMPLQGALQLKLSVPKKDTNLLVSATAAGRDIENEVVLVAGKGTHLIR